MASGAIIHRSENSGLTIKIGNKQVERSIQIHIEIHIEGRANILMGLTQIKRKGERGDR